jgi:hypothetical protein
MAHNSLVCFMLLMGSTVLVWCERRVITALCWFVLSLDFPYGTFGISTFVSPTGTIQLFQRLHLEELDYQHHGEHVLGNSLVLVL